LAAGRFQRVLGDKRDIAARRILLCSGKVFFDLADFREKNDRNDVAILRVEQFYPLPDDALNHALSSYSSDTEVVWVQEEPLNMGAWRHWQQRFGEHIGTHPLRAVGRIECASPATGSKARHKREQNELVAKAFDSG
jgi:2-oxoglutarate dehydrogenase E1 component